jgi:hypothetical protein
MTNLERESIKSQIKLAKAFKAVISAGLVAPVFVSAAACGKEQPAVEEEQADEPTTAIIETTPENKETQPVVKEENPPPTEVEEAKPVEWEGVVINPIEGLRFDNGVFFAQENNPYGLEAETKAGVFIKDAFEFNGEIENSIGLRPEVIKYLQKMMVEKDHELRFALPLNFKTESGIKIDIFEDTVHSKPSSNTAESVIPLGKFTYLGISGIKNEMTLLSPVQSTMRGELDGALYNGFFSDRDDNNTFELSIEPDKEFFENTFWKKEYPVHSGLILMKFSSAELLVKEGMKLHPEIPNNSQRRTEMEVGTPLAKIFGPPDPEVAEHFFFSNYSFLMQYVVTEYGYDENKGQYYKTGQVFTGEDILMEQGGIKISFLLTSADD